MTLEQERMRLVYSGLEEAVRKTNKAALTTAVFNAASRQVGVFAICESLRLLAEDEFMEWIRASVHVEGHEPKDEPQVEIGWR